MVTILGQSVAIKRELAELAPVVNGDKPPRPTRDYRLVFRSDRPLIDLLHALQGYGEVINMSSEIIEQPSAVAKRSELAPRYRHPLNPEWEWTGRDRRPGWLEQFLQGPGRTIEQCLINNHSLGED
jgi:hypothetical protein